MTTKARSLALLTTLLLSSSVALAQVPRTISYQGVLTDASGTLIPDGNHTLTLKLYDAASGGSVLWTETQPIPVVRGMFNVLLGSATPIPTSVAFDRAYFLGVSVDGATELAPRTPLTAAPYALYAARAGEAESLAPSATGVVTSLNGAEGAITLNGGGSTTINRSGNTITISSTGGSGGTGIQGVQSSDAAISVSNGSGPVASLALVDGGIGSGKLADGSVTTDKITQVGALTGDVLTFNGSNVTWASPVSLVLPYAGSTGSASDAFNVTSTAATSVPLHGINSAATGSSAGVVGEASSTSHGVGATGGVTGVIGRVTPTTPGGYSAGVRGLNNGTSGTGIGVIGYQAGSGWGVYGETPSGFGVYGLTTNNSAASSGVRGETFSTNGIGVEAKYSGTGVGVALELDNGAIRVAGVNKAAFVHTATAANKLSANGTDITNPMCDGDPNAILIVTQKLNPSGIVYNNSPIGVYYNSVRNKWEIFNENNVAIPNNAQFNVFVIKQ